MNLCIWTASTDKPSTNQDSAQSSSKGPGGPSAEESSSEEATPAPDCVGFQGNMSIGQILAYYDGYDSSSSTLGATVTDADGNKIADMGPPGVTAGPGSGVDTVMLQSLSDPTGGTFMGGLLAGVSQYCVEKGGCGGSDKPRTSWCDAGGTCYQQLPGVYNGPTFQLDPNSGQWVPVPGSPGFGVNVTQMDTLSFQLTNFNLAFEGKIALAFWKAQSTPGTVPQMKPSQPKSPPVAMIQSIPF